MKKTIYRLLFILFLICFAFCCGTMSYRYVVRHNADEAMEKVKEETIVAEEIESRKTDSNSDSVKSNTNTSVSDESVVTESTASDNAFDKQAEVKPVDILKERGISIPEKNIDWDELHSQNPDIYAWIYVPGTNIDYPILQHPEDKSYYLNHNIDGSEGYPGCIYTQNVNKKDWTDPNTVIYGHNMNNGSMFHDLHKFEDAVFFDETQYLYIYTPERTLVYEIFASYPFSNIDLIMCFDYSTPEALLVYFDGIWTNRSMTSHFRDSVVLYGDSRIITMSTCIGGQPEMRYLVQAVLLNPEAK